jgi:hypothetical protein
MYTIYNIVTIYKLASPDHRWKDIIKIGGKETSQILPDSVNGQM